MHCLNYILINLAVQLSLRIFSAEVEIIQFKELLYFTSEARFLSL